MTSTLLKLYKYEMVQEGLFKFKQGINGFFTYSTTRSATIKSFRIGIIYRIVQFVLLYYIVGWELVKNKAYQKHDTVSSCLRTRVKGDGLVPIYNKSYDFFKNKPNRSDPQYYRNLFAFNPNLDYQIIDPADYVVPPNEYNGVFITTKFIKTEQSYGFCDRNTTMKLIALTSQFFHLVIREKLDLGVQCDEENLIRNVLNYTIFIRNNVEFKYFNIKLRNLRKEYNEKFIRECANYEIKNPNCPVFTLDYILSQAEKNETERYLMLLKGTAIEIQIIWNCDFDFLSEDECFPKYSFSAINLPFKTTAASNGYSIWYSNHYKIDNVDYRTLYKAYGVRIIINVTGRGGKFDIVPLLLTVGAGLGLMSISVIVAECVMLNCSKNKRKYQEIKEFEVKEELILPHDHTTQSLLLHSNNVNSNSVTHHIGNHCDNETKVIRV